ncbi:MAG: hypothetical protein FI707_16350 [SAR202 cluster bacterium]|jgi:cyanophycinase|nr:hypothetical protein [Chloroflexota bacterium]MDP6419901.1 Type 1 glutamine amidotransferase-like domain-containing protein [SAR202 cluster bacterium]MQG56394.1 hypothetical protein [SAR202 cluster bacterium]MQG70343.1 hypothetical protein [SAR202 cluster bacterium]|tara:strand:- start:1076 stop:1762 length:687 start_codon:yes stop_codon:yes gene_type:complete
MVERIALIGGDEFRQGCEEADRAILNAVGAASPKVLIVPTAAVEGSPSMAVDNGVRYFTDLGADAESLMVLDSSDARDEGLADEVELADVVYLSGGNPAYLLDTLSDSTVLRAMLDAYDRGAWIAGSSAGAMVLGAWMRFRTWTQALDIAKGLVTLPHHERADPETTSADLVRDAPSGLTAAFGIDGRTGCLAFSDGWKVLGPGAVTVYEAGSWRKFSSSESFTLKPG